MFRRLLLAALPALATLAPAAAEGLVQLRFGGRASDLLSAQDPDQRQALGTLVEVEVTARVSADTDDPFDGLRTLWLHVHVAPGTTGADLAALVSRRARDLGIRAITTEGSGNLWIEAATEVNLRVGGGLAATIACAEGPPASLAVRPPARVRQGARLQVHASTVILPSGELPVRGMAALTVPLEPEASAASISAALASAGQGEWVSDRPKGDSWRPIRMVNGAAFTGFSCQLSPSAGTSQASGDWRLELTL